MSTKFDAHQLWLIGLFLPQPSSLPPLIRERLVLADNVGDIKRHVGPSLAGAIALVDLHRLQSQVIALGASTRFLITSVNAAGVWQARAFSTEERRMSIEEHLTQYPEEKIVSIANLTEWQQQIDRLDQIVAQQQFFEIWYDWRSRNSISWLDLKHASPSMQRQGHTA